jgi:hypothetical protein
MKERGLQIFLSGSLFTCTKFDDSALSRHSENREIWISGAIGKNTFYQQMNRMDWQ